MAVSMPMRNLTISLLLTLLLVSECPSSAQTRKAPRPAWTSTLQCLAPLAREARSGTGPLAIGQAFFDGPFIRPEVGDDGTSYPVLWKSSGIEASAAHHLSAGFSYLLAFDTPMAERHFREVTVLNSGVAAAYIGLMLANADDGRRASCFLNEAALHQETASDPVKSWLDLLEEHFKGGALTDSKPLIAEWGALAESSENPAIAAALLRQLILLEIQSPGTSDTDETFTKIAATFPELPVTLFRKDNASATGSSQQDAGSTFFLRQPQLLRLIENQNAPTASPHQRLESLEQIAATEIRRIEDYGTIMLEASLNLGDTANSLFNLYRETDQASQAIDLAHTLDRLPRDLYSPGTRWRRLTRENTLWVIARAAQASLYFERQDWQNLQQLPRGFSPEDRAEWYTWQVAAALESGQDFNPWLAALRREPGSDGLVDAAESYLQWKTSKSNSPPPEIQGLNITMKSNSKAEPTLEASASPPLPAARIKLPLTRPATDFSLPDWEGKELSLSQLKGKPVIIIFFLGGGCLHCVEQLAAFTPWADRFNEAGIEMLAVSTDPVSILSNTLSFEASPSETFPIPIVSNHELDVFQAWHVYDEFDQRALHGTFLISPTGEILWEEIGNTPYMHPDYLLHEAKRMLNVSH